jgi:hypothetical protein
MHTSTPSLRISIDYGSEDMIITCHVSCYIINTKLAQSRLYTPLAEAQCWTVGLSFGFAYCDNADLQVGYIYLLRNSHPD